MGFWGPNGHDAIWHLALISQINFLKPIINPIYAPEYLQHYHLGFDIFVAYVSKLLPLFSVSDLYFRFLPLVFSICLGILSIKLYASLNQSKKGTIPLLFFIYFAGSFGWIINLIRFKSLGGESLFWSMQAASALLNPPYILSLLLLLFGLISFDNKKNPLLVGIIFSLSTAVKVYAGILIGFSLLTLTILRPNRYKLIITLVHGLLSFFVLYLYGALRGPSLLHFQPFWFTHSLISAYDKLYLPSLATLQANLSQNIFSYKLPILVAIELFLVFVFWFGNMGTRILGLKEIFQTKNTDLVILLRTTVLLGFLTPVFFIQKGTAWNTIQFLYYSLFFLSFFATFAVKDFSTPVLIVVLVFTCIGSISTIKDYLGFPPPTAIYPAELEALGFLKQQPKGLVLTYPYDQFEKDKYAKTPLPIYAYESTAYVSAISHQSTFLSDEVNLTIMDIPYQSRLKDIRDFFSNPEKYKNRGFLLNNQITYIYLTHQQKLPLSTEILQIDKIFNNSQVEIYKVRR